MRIIDAQWLRLSDTLTRVQLIRELNRKVRLRAREIRLMQERLDSLHARVTALEGP